ncbi:MAG: hypothetical protein LBD41_07700 [Clostridiales Family XIII bacterium]|nr:hypothetical protein [Clostridiales Family XIII bacterium]
MYTFIHSLCLGKNLLDKIIKFPLQQFRNSKNALAALTQLEFRFASKNAILSFLSAKKVRISMKGCSTVQV